MIDRYTTTEMGNIWSLKSRYQAWLDVELAACKAMNTLKIIPDADYANISQKANFDVERIAVVEEQTRHDIIAFLTVVAEYVGESSRWIHFGMTSSDVLDTATALQCKQAGELLLQSMSAFCDVLKKRALEFATTICIGRSHGVHAEPTCFGLKFALWYDEMQRNMDRLRSATRHVSVGKFSGAVGNYAHLSPEVEVLACEYLGLTPANIATQVIQRDLHAEFMSAIAITGTTLEKIAIEIRHLQRTEVLEVEENFSKGQKGSSAMPHKKNPIVSEQMTGLARLLRTNAFAALEDNALWHERDISHSSVERVILPDNCILLHYMLVKMILLIEHLTVYPQNIQRNLELTNGLVFSQVLLLRLAEKGMTREAAYATVQKHAMHCWESRVPLRSLIENDAEMMGYLDTGDLDNIFSYERYMRHVDNIYKRVFEGS